MWKVCLALALAASPSLADQKCGVTKPPALGVSDAAVFPWTGLVYYSYDENKELRPLAMGTLVDKQHVLVPAYVATPPPKQTLKYIQFGTTELDNPISAQNFTVLKIIIHPEYKSATRPTNTNDIAVIRLAEPVTFSETISPACLPQKSENYDAEKYYFVSYNTGHPSAHEDARKQKYVSQLRRIKSAECEEKYSTLMKIINSENSASYTCAGDTENDSCSGDAGSPLLVQNDDSWTAVAISIFGPRACKTGVPSAFLNLQPYVEWIQGVLAEI